MRGQSRHKKTFNQNQRVHFFHRDQRGHGQDHHHDHWTALSTFYFLPQEKRILTVKLAQYMIARIGHSRPSSFLKSRLTPLAPSSQGGGGRQSPRNCSFFVTHMGPCEEKIIIRYTQTNKRILFIIITHHHWSGSSKMIADSQNKLRGKSGVGGAEEDLWLQFSILFIHWEATWGYSATLQFSVLQCIIV